jgi:hypothetical protein
MSMTFYNHNSSIFYNFSFYLNPLSKYFKGYEDTNSSDKKGGLL